MAELLRLINPEAPPATDGFVMTETAQDIQRSLSLVRSVACGALTMVAAVPGAGKTRTTWHCKCTSRRVIYHAAVAAEGNVRGVAGALMEALDTGEPNSRRLRDDRRRIAAEIGPEALLILDEAQYLIERNPREGTNLETFEWLRACAAEGFLSIAFCGDLALLKVVEHLPQLCSRIIRPVIVRQVPKGDMAAVADRSGIRDAGSIDALHAVARHFGGLRDVAQAIAHAGRFAGKGPITLSHIMAAIADLKLQPNGSK